MLEKPGRYRKNIPVLGASQDKNYNQSIKNSESTGGTYEFTFQPVLEMIQLC
jgi:hypothetical protein